MRIHDNYFVYFKLEDAESWIIFDSRKVVMINDNDYCDNARFVTKSWSWLVGQWSSHVSMQYE